MQSRTRTLTQRSGTRTRISRLSKSAVFSVPSQGVAMLGPGMAVLELGHSPYATVTAICFGLAFSAFGSAIVSTPFFSEALIFSWSICSPNWNWR